MIWTAHAAMIDKKQDYIWSNSWKGLKYTIIVFSLPSKTMIIYQPSNWIQAVMKWANTVNIDTLYACIVFVVMMNLYGNTSEIFVKYMVLYLMAVSKTLASFNIEELLKILPQHERNRS